mgnify:CR=1 FL=1|nr:macro domain-containing protein [uncultured Blautia sp.]
MPFKIVRNDLTKMQVDAIVNTTNPKTKYSFGTDSAVYKAAGIKELLEERKKIGYMNEGEVALTSGFKLPAKYIIYAVSPRYIDGDSGEEKKLRSCYQKSLALAEKYECKSIAFPLIATGSFGYPKEEGMRIALDEINTFLMQHDMLVYLVVFDRAATKLGQNLYPDLESYIDHNYVQERHEEEYGNQYFEPGRSNETRCNTACFMAPMAALEERMEHMSDTFQEYLMYLIRTKQLTNAEVYKRAIVTKQLFSKIKLNPQYHPDKATAMRLCTGAKLNLDETKDLLARAGYALSPCDKRDIIFSFFIEHEVFDMIEIDIALEEYGLPCFIE